MARRAATRPRYRLGAIAKGNSGHYTVAVLRGRKIVLRHTARFGTKTSAATFGRRLVRSLNAGRGGVV